MIIRAYEVTVTPKQTVYSGTWRNGEYTAKVYAKSRSEAITIARREYNEENGGRHGIPATYRAKIQKEEI